MLCEFFWGMHGLAFDGGRFDRMVCEGRDDEDEIQNLTVCFWRGGGGALVVS